MLSMKLYRFATESWMGYAVLVTWNRGPELEPFCPVCGVGAFRDRVFPAKLQYEPGRHGDFMSGPGPIKLATRPIAEELRDTFEGLEIKQVLMRKGTRQPEMQGIPGTAIYEGPELVEIWIKHSLSIVETKHTFPTQTCPACTRTRISNWSGVAHGPLADLEDGRSVMKLPEPRQPGKGVFIKESQMQGEDFIRFGRFLPLCTQRVKEFIEARGWTNIEFFEYGDVVPD
jgi:hypothetical protein